MALTFPGNRISLFQVANFNAFTECFIQLDDETAKMAECYICCLTPPTDKGKMKAFPSCLMHPDGCGRSANVGDVVWIDGLETISVNAWMLAVPVKKALSGARRPVNKDLGCTIGYCKVVYSQFHLVVNRKAKITELIPDTNPTNRTANMGKFAMGCAKVAFLDGKKRDELTMV
jgi:hypothetical protein